jgi:ATP-dependent Clp protease ATP-binding subunit ClpA
MPNDRMERFTVRSRQVLKLSQEEALSMQHGEIGTEHLLLGLIREEGGIAGRVLRDVGVQYQTVRSIIKDVNNISKNSSLDLATDTKKLLEFAVDEARRRGDHFIGTEHLLLALIRQSYNKACTTLKHLNIDTDDVYQRAEKFQFDEQTTFFPAFAGIALAAVLIAAQDEARQMNSQSIEPEHLFLALLRNSDGTASYLIRELNLTYEQIRAMVHIIKRPPTNTNSKFLSPPLSHDGEVLLNDSYLPYGNFSDRLLLALLREWWLLSDLWNQVFLRPEQLQTALNNLEIPIRIQHHQYSNLDQWYALRDSFFPPPLRRALRSFVQNLRNKRTGKHS